MPATFPSVPSTEEHEALEQRVTAAEDGLAATASDVGVNQVEIAMIKSRLDALEAAPPAPEPEPEPEPDPSWDPGNYNLLSWRDFGAWETDMRGGSQPKLRFFPHVSGGVTPYAEGDTVVCEVPGGSQSYRSELTIQEHLEFDHDTYRELMNDSGVQYALAYPFELDVTRADGSPFDVGSLVEELIICQIHDSSQTNSPPVALRVDGGNLVVNELLIGNVQTIATGLENGRRYNLVFGYKVNDGGVDEIEVWLEGLHVHSIASAGIFADNLGLFLKHGLYEVDRDGSDNTIRIRLKAHKSGYGQFAGPDAIQAALAKALQ